MQTLYFGAISTKQQSELLIPKIEHLIIIENKVTKTDYRWKKNIILLEK